MSVADRLGLSVRRFALERTKKFQPNPAKFMAAVERAEARGDAHVLSNLARVAERFAGTGENARLGAHARKVFHDGAAARADKLIASGKQFPDAASYVRHLSRVEENIVATRAMLEVPRAEVTAAAAAKQAGHARLAPPLEAVRNDLAVVRRPFEERLAKARKELAEAQAALARREHGAQSWVDRTQLRIQEIEREAAELTAKPTGWVAREQGKYDEGMRPLVVRVQAAEGEVGKLESPLARVTEAFRKLGDAIGGLTKMKWRMTQKFDPNAHAEALKRLGL